MCVCVCVCVRVCVCACACACACEATKGVGLKTTLTRVRVSISATNSPNMAELPNYRGQAEEDKCSVCLESPKEARALPCCHTFCTECLEGLLEEAGDNLVCPNCRGETAVPLDGVEGFPRDFAAQKSEEYRSFSAQDEIEAPCKSCEDTDTANAEPAAYCGECGGGICEGCVEQHHRMKAFKKHELVDWEEFSADSFKPKRLHRKCNIHPNMGVQLYCEQCNQFVCSLCLKERHKIHIDSAKCLDEVCEKRITKVGQLQEVAEKRLVVCEKRLLDLKEAEEGLAGYPDSIKKSIINAFEEYMGKLRTWREQLLAEAEDRCREIGKSITAQQIDADNAMKKLYTGIQFAKKAVSCNENDEIIEMSGTAINQLEDTMEACDDSPFKRPLVFEKGELRLGKLREIEHDDFTVKVPEYSFMNTENAIQVNFTVSVNTRPAVKMLYGSQKQCSLTLYPPVPADTACTVYFFPRCAGKHSIEVHVGGVICRRFDDIMVVRGAPEQGSNVKPGPDWGEDQFEEEITHGTVLKVEQLAQTPRKHCVIDDEEELFEVTVQWNNGRTVKYKWGDTDEYQLELDVEQ